MNFTTMQELPVSLSTPYELWREDGVLHLTLNPSARIGLFEIKEVLRLVRAMDPVSNHLVMVHSDGNVSVSSEARILLSRSCNGELRRSVAFVADTLSARITADMFALLNRPKFPFKVVSSAREACKWFVKSRSV